MPRRGNLNNLKKWKKGQSGNPKGRPKKIIPNLDKLLAEMIGTSGNETSESTIKDILQNLIDISKTRKVDSVVVSAALAIIDRAYGKVPQKIDNKHEFNKPIVIDWSDDYERNNGGKNNNTANAETEGGL